MAFRDIAASQITTLEVITTLPRVRLLLALVDAMVHEIRQLELLKKPSTQLDREGNFHILKSYFCSITFHWE